jgi:hypothetical protein
MASAHLEVVRLARPARHRAKALILTSIGWMIGAVPAVLFAAGSWLGPASVLLVGTVLLVLCARAHGDVPFAAVGVGMTFALAMGLATVALVGAMPVALVAAVLGGVGLSAVVLWALTWPSPAVRLGRASVWAWAAVAFFALLTFPGRERIELAVLELSPGSAAPDVAPVDGPAPTALARAPSHGPRAVEARTGPSLRTATRRLAAVQHAGWIWLVGLLLAGAGSVAALRTLARLRSLRGARHARRTAHGYVLEDGEPIELEPPSEAASVVVRAGREAAYRGTAVPRAQLLGEGDVSGIAESLRQRSLVIALGTLVTATAAWLPLVVLG